MKANCTAGLGTSTGSKRECRDERTDCVQLAKVGYCEMPLFKQASPGLPSPYAFKIFFTAAMPTVVQRVRRAGQADYHDHADDTTHADADADDDAQHCAADDYGGHAATSHRCVGGRRS